MKYLIDQLSWSPTLKIHLSPWQNFAQFIATILKLKCATLGESQLAKQSLRRSHESTIQNATKPTRDPRIYVPALIIVAQPSACSPREPGCVGAPFLTQGTTNQDGGSHTLPWKSRRAWSRESLWKGNVSSPFVDEEQEKGKIKKKRKKDRWRRESRCTDESRRKCERGLTMKGDAGRWWKQREPGRGTSEGWRENTDFVGMVWMKSRGSKGVGVRDTQRYGKVAGCWGWNEFIFTEAACICEALRRVCRPKYTEHGCAIPLPRNTYYVAPAKGAAWTNFTRSRHFVSQIRPGAKGDLSLLRCEGMELIIQRRSLKFWDNTIISSLTRRN